MSNLTISVDDALIKRARVRAIQQGTSLSAKVREFLLHYVSEEETDLQKLRAESTAQLMAALDAAAALATPDPTPDGAAKQVGSARRTLRDDIYDGDFRARDREAARARRSA